MSAFFATVLLLLAVFLILLVLVQRGRGGGLAGALGGAGGSSAFGAKAGDVFTKITIVTASVWIAVCVAAVFWANRRGDALTGADVLSNAPASSSPAEPGATTGAGAAATDAVAPASDAGAAAPASGTPAAPAADQ